MTSERYYCVNCNQLVSLNQHGRCAICNSAQVISENVIQQLSAPKASPSVAVHDKVTGEKYIRIPMKLYCVRLGYFYTTVYASSELDAATRAASPTRTWQIDFDLYQQDACDQFTVEVVDTKPLSEQATLRGEA